MKQESHYRSPRLLVRFCEYFTIAIMIICCALGFVTAEPILFLVGLVGGFFQMIILCVARAVFDLADIHHEQLDIQRKRLQELRIREMQEQDRRA